MTEHVDQSDLVLNEKNLFEARGLRILRSWLPPRDSSSIAAEDEEDFSTNPSETAAKEENDTSTMTETVGIGSKRMFDSEDTNNEPVTKKRIADNKLMEQLLGKQAAQARRKNVEAQAPRHTLGQHASKVAVVSKKIVTQDESDDEGGRAAVIVSRKAKASRLLNSQSTIANRTAVEEEVQADEEETRNASAVRNREASTPTTSTEKVHVKQKPGSYLDEVLEHRAAKKKKKEKRKHS